MNEKQTEEWLNENTDGLIAVTLKIEGNKKEFNTIMAVSPDTEEIEQCVSALSQAITVFLFKNTSANFEDIHNLLIDSVAHGIAKGKSEVIAKKI
ncbi:hypothetical protein SECTIM467_166 [Brevibacillus phage SecTim467]|uniref:Uncharacterized protein n=2 Tax=Jenstvirus jenst TaxID=1982225 RepID=A0A0K2CPJ8_9CAUD|nr:hypothetical protein AVV11_gp030 [Brevibacillus phage Jenst]ALA07290.1 hypothetical protein JENST_161 [Brevibacillus phage Jenst]ALA07489.1 hypothetical protein SECTIM467_166 [Brevibacillus phage SecTim467]